MELLFTFNYSNNLIIVVAFMTAIIFRDDSNGDYDNQCDNNNDHFVLNFSGSGQRHR